MSWFLCLTLRHIQQVFCGKITEDWQLLANKLHHKITAPSAGDLFSIQQKHPVKANCIIITKTNLWPVIVWNSNTLKISFASWFICSWISSTWHSFNKNRHEQHLKTSPKYKNLHTLQENGRLRKNVRTFSRVYHVTLQQKWQRNIKKKTALLAWKKKKKQIYRI